MAEPPENGVWMIVFLTEVDFSRVFPSLSEQNHQNDDFVLFHHVKQMLRKNPHQNDHQIDKMMIVL